MKEKKEEKSITDYVVFYVIIGLLLGIVLGNAIQNAALGIFAGTVIGLASGVIQKMNKKIEKENNKTMVSSSLSENLKHSGIRINDKQHQQLLDYVGLDGMSFDMLNRAVEITSEVYQPSFKYLRGILENWKKKGFTTIEGRA